MIAIKKIKMNGYSSSDFPAFDLILDCSVGGSDNGAMSTYLTREGVASETYDGRKKNISNLKYTEVFSPKITILKKGFEDFTMDEQRQVLKWLTGSDKVTFFDFYDDIYSEAPIFCVLGFVSTIETYKIANKRTIGYIVTLESISPFAYSPINIFERTITEPTTFIIECNSDDPAYVYPRVIVEHNTNPVVRVNKAMLDESEHALGTVYYYPEATNGKYYYWIDANRVLHNEATNTSNFTTTSVVIRNTETGTETVVRGSQQSETVVIDGANKVIYSDTYPNRVFGDKFGSNEHNLWQWLPLQNGINTITVIGNCKLTFNWREIRKIGEY